MGKRRKSPFESEVSRSLKMLDSVYNPIFYHKLKDSSHSMRPSPFDHIAIVHGKYASHVFGIECKMVRGNTFNFKMVPPHQEEALLKISRMRNCHGYVLVNFRGEGMNRCFALSILTFLRHKSTKEKSLSIDEMMMDDNCIEIHRITHDGEKIWGLGKILFH